MISISFGDSLIYRGHTWKYTKKGPKTNRRRRSKTLPGPNIKEKGPSPEEFGCHARGDMAQAHPAACQPKVIAGQCHPGAAAPGGGCTLEAIARAHLWHGGSINAPKDGLGGFLKYLKANHPIQAIKGGGHPLLNTHNKIARREELHSFLGFSQNQNRE